MLKLSKGEKKEPKRTGISLARLNQYFGMAARDPFRLTFSGPGGFAEEWAKAKIDVEIDSNLAGQGGYVILQTKGDGAGNFVHTNTVILHRASDDSDERDFIGMIDDLVASQEG